MRGVYLLHFARPVGKAQHYLGFSTDVDRRVVLHARGISGAHLPREAYLRGITFTLARVWPEATPSFERELKNRYCRRSRAGFAELCPECGILKNHPALATTTTLTHFSPTQKAGTKNDAQTAKIQPPKLSFQPQNASNPLPRRDSVGTPPVRQPADCNPDNASVKPPKPPGLAD